MSYTFNDTGRLAGDLGAAYGYPHTIALWIQYVTHPVLARTIVQYGANSASQTASFQAATNSTTQQARAWNYNDAATSANLNSSANGVNATWLPLITVYNSQTDRAIYFNSTSGSTSATDWGATADARYLSIGRSLASTGGFSGDIAEVAIWSGTTGLTAQERADYIAGKSANQINATYLRFYNPLRGNSGGSYDLTEINADALKVGPSLTLVGTAPVYNASHPTIDYGTSGANLLLKHNNYVGIEGVTLSYTG
jgi:hypothetical protein